MNMRNLRLRESVYTPFNVEMIHELMSSPGYQVEGYYDSNPDNKVGHTPLLSPSRISKHKVLGMLSSSFIVSV